MKKRNFFVVAIAVVSLALATSAHAQVTIHEDGPNITVDVKFNQVPANQVIEQIAKELDYLVVFTDETPTQIITTDFVKANLGELLGGLLKELGGYVSKTTIGAGGQKILLISKAASGRATSSRDPLASPTTALPSAGSVALPPPPMARVHVCDLPNMYTVPGSYSPQLGMAEGEWILARNRLPCAPSYPSQLSMPTVGYAGNYQSGYVGHGVSPATYGYGYMVPWMKGCQDGRPSSYLEVQYRGRRDEKHLWLISINGIGVGTVDQGDSLSQKLPVCSDSAVTVTVEKIGLDWKWQRQYSQRPFTSTEVPVGEFLANDKPRVTKNQ